MKPELTYDAFLEIEKKLDIRFGQIISVERVPKSDKMLKLSVDFGTEIGNKTVMTNIGDKLEDITILENIKLPFIMNFPPRKIMGIESQAMIMVATDAEGNIEFINPTNGSKLI